MKNLFYSLTVHDERVAIDLYGFIFNDVKTAVELQTKTSGRLRMI
ncbi:hypothetical protein AB0Y20_20565 [Heyndrickxia oleronia]